LLRGWECNRGSVRPIRLKNSYPADHAEIREIAMNPRQTMRQLIEQPGYTMVPGAYDTLTARLVEAAGFAAVYLTGGGYSRASGYPDLGLLTLGENVRFIGLTVEAVAIPVIADADTGYGNALNVIRTVREYEKSGVAAFHLEDQVSPKKCGHYEGKEVISRAEMVGKIKAAVDTRRDPQMVIIARSDARAIEGIDAAIDRVNAYLEAGADVGFVEAPQNVDEMRLAGRSLRGPSLVNVFEGGKTPMLAASELEAMGFRLGIYPSQTHRAAIRAAQRVLRAMKEDGDTRRVEGDLATFQEREDAVGTASWSGLEQKYMRVEP
jgi:2-methylisocitrate lyase-like PEP mutase family enzyme